MCDANDNDSECAAGCQARKRREAPIGVKQYNVATQFRVLPKFWEKSNKDIEPTYKSLNWSQTWLAITPLSPSP